MSNNRPGPTPQWAFDLAEQIIGPYYSGKTPDIGLAVAAINIAAAFKQQAAALSVPKCDRCARAYDASLPYYCHLCMVRL